MTTIAVALGVALLCAAYQLGYSSGHNAGINEGKQLGKREGAMRGFAVGYDRGKRERTEDAADKTEEADKAGNSLLPIFVFLMVVTVIGLTLASRIVR